MANSNLTMTMVTREILRVLHQKANFLRTITRSYDDSYAKTGAKIGDTLKIRLPNEYTVTTGAALGTQDLSETSVDLTVATQKHVGLNFTSDDLTLDLDDFSTRIIDPAVSVLVASVEADGLQTMTKQVANLIDSDGSAFSYTDILNGRRRLNECLAPQDGSRSALLSPAHSVKIVDALKGLFHSSEQIDKQYIDGEMGKSAGFSFFENTHVTDHTTGTAAEGDTLYNVNGAAEDGSTITVDTGSTTFLVGDVVTFAGANAVHPETKVSLGYLKQFVITANSGASATTLTIDPPLVASGGRQNVSGFPTNAGAVSKIGAGNAETLNGSLVYHKNAFAFATADLVMPRGVDMAAREVLDGVSMRLVRQYDINNDKFPCRLDILYGYKAIRQSLACRLHADG